MVRIPDFVCDECFTITNASTKWHYLALPWFDRDCSPNVKKHWTKLSAARKKQRQIAFLAAMGLPKPESGRILIVIVFCPARSNDLDNCLASIKGALDGVADALGVDDKLFRLTPFMGKPTKKPRIEFYFNYNTKEQNIG